MTETMTTKPSSWHTLPGSLSGTSIEPLLLQRFEERVSTVAVGAMTTSTGGIDPELVQAIRLGREELQGGGAKEGAHRAFGVKWAYWSFMTCLFAFRLTNILKRALSVAEVLHSPRRLAVMQLGAGPAEDCIGLLEYFRMTNSPSRAVEYICIDDVDHRDQLAQIQDFAVQEYQAQPMTLRQIQGDISSSALEKILPQPRENQVLLVLVANLLVAGSKNSESLTEGVARIAKLALRGRPKHSSCVILIEPRTQQHRVEAVMDQLCGVGGGLPERFRYRYTPSPTTHLQILGIKAEPMERDSIFATCTF